MEKEKMLAGELYLATDPELTAARMRARRLMQRFNALDPEDEPGRAELLRELLGHVGQQCWVEPPFQCDYGWNIHVGDRLFINFNCVIIDCNRVTIGNDVFIGPGVHIYTAEHPVDPEERIRGPELARPVTIGDKVWLGGGVIVCPGVTIGEGSTVGAGSVVVRDIPPHVVAVGNPCRVVRHLR